MRKLTIKSDFIFSLQEPSGDSQNSHAATRLILSHSWREGTQARGKSQGTAPTSLLDSQVPSGLHPYPHQQVPEDQSQPESKISSSQAHTKGRRGLQTPLHRTVHEPRKSLGRTQNRAPFLGRWNSLPITISKERSRKALKGKFILPPPPTHTH